MKKKILGLDETDSTNLFLHSYRMEDGDEMVVATAEYQNAGRGQGSNTWESEKGANLLFSVKIRPVAIPVDKQFLLSMVMALAVKGALDRYADGFTLKWPNDIYWNDYKISGTLIETSLSGRCVNSCIFGIGIDVNQKVFHGDAPNPISLSAIVGRDVDRKKLLDEILSAFENRYNQLLEDGSDVILRDYHDALYRKSGCHKYSDGKQTFMAYIDSVGTDGRLVLRDTEGTLRRYAFKEVAFVLENQK